MGVARAQFGFIAPRPKVVLPVRVKFWLLMDNEAFSAAVRLEKLKVTVADAKRPALPAASVGADAAAMEYTLVPVKAAEIPDGVAC